MQKYRVHCPSCGQLMDSANSLVVEYWIAKETILFCWCAQCRWRGEIKEVLYVTATEMDEEH